MRHSLDNFLREVMQEHDGDTCEVDPGSPKEGTATGQTTLPGHEVEQLIARGGMGKVYRARQVVLEREVAVKVMSSLAASPKMAERFWREALVLARLEHPNIVPIYDMGMNEEGQPYYTMKLVKGRTLQTILNDLLQGDAATVRGHTLSSLLTVYIKVCDALAFAHSLGILHRDLKPENVMVGQFGEVQVMDWGLAKSRNDDGGMTNDEPELPSAADSSSVMRNSSLTLQGAVMGTPQYMSPEQAMGRIVDLDERSDIFSLGGILYAILALRSPVEGGTANEVLEKVRSGSITPPSLLMTNHSRTGGGAPLSAPVKPLPHVAGGRVPAALSAVAMKALQADPAKRYQSVTALRADVEAYQNGFATSAQGAGTLTQLWLLTMRHKAMAAVIAVMVLMCIGFVVNLMASERRAKASEAVAITEQEAARRALAKSQIALADAAYFETDSAGVLAALEAIPERFRDSDWHYLHRRADNSLARFPGSFSGVAAHPKHPGVFALISRTQTLCLVDAATGEQLSAFPLADRQKQTTSFPALAFSSDGKKIGVGGEGDSGIAVYDAETGRCLSTWDAIGTTTLSFSPDGSKILDTNAAQQLTVRAVETGKVIWNQGRASCAIFAPTGEVVSGFRNSNLRVSQGETGAPVRTIRISAGTVRSLAMTPDGSAVCYATSEGTVQAIRFTNGEDLLPDAGIEDYFRRGGRRLRVAFGNGGRTLVAATNRNDGLRMVHAWNMTDGLKLDVPLGGEGSIEGLAVHPDAPLIISTGDDTRSWRVGGHEPEHRLVMNASPFASDFWGSDDVVVFGEQVVKLPENGGPPVPLWALPKDFKALVRADASRDVLVLGVTGLEQSEVSRVKVLQRQGERFIEKVAIDSPQAVRGMQLSADGRSVALVHPYDPVSIYDTSSGQLRCRLELKGFDFVRSGQWVGEDRFLGVASTGDSSRKDFKASFVLWDTRTGQEIRRCESDRGIGRVASKPDQRIFAAGSGDGHIRIHDAETLATLREIRAHDGPALCLAFHPTEPVLFSGAAGNPIRVWNLTDDRLVAEFHASTKVPSALKFSPTGKRLLSTEQGGKAFVWNLEKLLR